MSKNQKKRAVELINPDQFRKEMAELVAYIKSITTPQEDERPRFPGFMLPSHIKEKAADCALAAGQDLARAFEQLDDVRRHFDCIQASYARRQLLGDLEDDLSSIIKEGWFQGLIDKVQIAVTAYKNAVNEKWFGLEAVSQLYWTAIDALNWAEEEQKKRNAQVRAQQELQEQQHREAQQALATRRNAERAQQTAAAREAQKVEQAALAKEMSTLVGTL